MIKKIWKDPVGSKIIAWLIILILTLIGIKIKSYYDEKMFIETIIFILNYKIQLWIAILFLLFLYLLKILYLSIFSKKDFYTKNQQKLREFNTLTDNEQGIRYEWTVWFSNRNSKPFISDLEFYCTRHDNVPLKFLGKNCYVSGCKNSKVNINEFKAKNYIESLVLDKWNKMK